MTTAVLPAVTRDEPTTWAAPAPAEPAAAPAVQPPAPAGAADPEPGAEPPAASPPDGLTPEQQLHVLRFVRGRPDAYQTAAVTLALLAVVRGGARPDRATTPAPEATWGYDRTYRAPGSWASARRFSPGR
ncbi:acyl-CoA carboxylase epsilon subunit [Streptomyces sp. NPDC048111]|uniref:acyl-CoA carboxylase epsilon subunit n=1 Tax=Streptomyces sp. NPDC048111 TaxID=3365500 RepID=UPI00371DDE85